MISCGRCRTRSWRRSGNSCSSTLYIGNTCSTSRSGSTSRTRSSWCARGVPCGAISTRVHRTMPWMVSCSSLRPFGPRRGRRGVSERQRSRRWRLHETGRRDAIVVIPRESTWSSGRRRRDATSDRVERPRCSAQAGFAASLATAKGPDLQIALEERDVVKRLRLALDLVSSGTRTVEIATGDLATGRDKVVFATANFFTERAIEDHQEGAGRRDGRQGRSGQKVPQSHRVDRGCRRMSRKSRRRRSGKMV